MSKPNQNLKRVVVIGSSCAGKTTFAVRLAKVLNSKHVELDSLHWEANWKEAEREAFRGRVTEALQSESWVVDGNYTNKIRDLVWPKADALIWLDPPLSLILRRFLWRSLSRTVRGEMLWGHSKENLRNSIFSKNSLLIWILTSHKRRTEEYLRLLENPPENTSVIRLRGERETSQFLANI